MGENRKGCTMLEKILGNKKLLLTLAIVYTVVICFATVVIDRTVLRVQLQNSMKEAFGNIENPFDQSQSDTQGKAPSNNKPSTKQKKTQNIGETFVLGDWEITLNSFDYVSRISNDGFGYYPADDGSQYLRLNFIITNNGTDSKQFDEWLGNSEIDTTLIYDEEYSYQSASFLSLSGYLKDTYFKPLADTESFLAFEIPDKIVESDKSLEVKFDFNKTGETVFVKIR